jgi:hypothetical protein
LPDPYEHVAIVRAAAPNGVRSVSRLSGLAAGREAQRMSDEQTLVPVEQKAADFYGDEVIAVRTGDHQIYVFLRHLCEAVGLTPN